MKKAGITIGTETFATKTALQRRAQAILHGGFREIVGGDLQFLLAFFARHQSADEKIGVGVRRVCVARMKPYGTPGFEIERVDGSLVDISYKECLAPSTPLQWFKRSCRTAVQDQKFAARDRAFANATELKCPIEGIPISRETCEVDHAPPWEFDKIVIAFLAERRIDPSEVSYIDGDGVTEYIFADTEIARAFAEFHRARASLRVVSRLANQSTLRRKTANSGAQK